MVGVEGFVDVVGYFVDMFGMCFDFVSLKIVMFFFIMWWVCCIVVED